MSHDGRHRAGQAGGSLGGKQGALRAFGVGTAAVGFAAIVVGTAVALAGVAPSQPASAPAAGADSSVGSSSHSPRSLASGGEPGTSDGTSEAPEPVPEAPEAPEAPAPVSPPTSPRAVDPPSAHSVTSDPDLAAVPVRCSDIYSPAMFDMLSSEPALPLNDGTTLEPPFSRSAGVAALQGSPVLSCTWGSAGDFGLLTQVNEVSKEQAAAAGGALLAAGFSCSERAGGTSCEVVHSEDGTEWGEFQFLRGNLWLCTFWLNIAIDGYTDDMVAALWP